MTISRQDVHALSSGPGPGGVPLPAAAADRVAAVLNQNCVHRPAAQTTGPAAGAAPAGGDDQTGSDPDNRPANANVPRQRVLSVMKRAGSPTAEG